MEFLIEHLISQYGLIIVYLGCALEGDTIAISAGVLAHRGTFPVWPTVLTVAAGGWTTDLVTFHLARLFRDHPRVVKAVASPMAQRLTSRFLARPYLLTAIFRFIPGARTVAPVMIATATQVRKRDYVLITFVSALAWGATMVFAGQAVGKLLWVIWGHITRPEIVFALAGLVIAFSSVRAIWRYFKAR